jgi:hypothetical protein
VALVGEAEVGGEPRQVLLAARQAIERGTGAEAHPVASDRVAGRPREDAAQVVGRDRQCACQLGEGAPGLRGQRLARAVGHGATSSTQASRAVVDLAPLLDQRASSADATACSSAPGAASASARE